MIKLTRKVLLLSAMAYGVGCADAGEDAATAEEPSTDEIVSEAEARKIEGQLPKWLQGTWAAARLHIDRPA